MKFLPTITLDNAAYEALRSGALKLQRGQWVRIPGDPTGVVSKPSRFVSAQPGFLNIVHPTGPFATGRFPVEAFRQRCANLR